MPRDTHVVVSPNAQIFAHFRDVVYTVIAARDRGRRRRRDLLQCKVPMANILPFRALRYDPARVRLAHVLTQPYDKITPQMQDHYYDASPYNLVRIILGKREPGDRPGNDVYSRAAQCFHDWRRDGILAQDAEPAIYAYSQLFRAPGQGEELERWGFIGLGRIEDYSAGVVFRHEQTLAKPKADRLELLRATRGHFGQIFMLYEDTGNIEARLKSQATPNIEVRDEYSVLHRVWRISDRDTVAFVREQMRDKRLIIADGHHRYETALTYRNERRTAHGAAAGANSGISVSRDTANAPYHIAPYEYVMMTFINMNARGLLILPTHRVVHSLPSFSAGTFATKAGKYFELQEVSGSVDPQRLTEMLRDAGRAGTALLAVTQDRIFLLKNPKPAAEEIFQGLSSQQRELYVVQLHRCLVEGVLALSEESIRNQQNISYVRDASEALQKVRTGNVNAVFLMNPARMQQVRDIAFAGEVLPQKSTDFYPKLLSGLTIYALE